MSDYTIYCTPEQTKQALELGAPLFRLYGTGCSDYIDMLIISDTEAYTIPTAEQLIGWLEEQGFQFNCNSNYLDEWEFLVYTAGKHSQLIGDSGWCENKKEATLAAIDAALEYLSINKK